MASHPLSPLTASEITTSAELIKGLYPTQTRIDFKAITLEEPEKAQLVPYLDAEHNGRSLPRISRKAFVNYYIRNTVSPSLWYIQTSSGDVELYLSQDVQPIVFNLALILYGRTNSMKPSSIYHRTKWKAMYV